MANTYGVTPDDVAAELRNLFPNGFAATTVPSLAQVVSYIAVADLEVSVAVQNAAGEAPQSDDRIAPLAKHVILNRVIARVLRVVYAGNAPADIAAVVSGYVDAATVALDAITALEGQAVGEGEPTAHVLTSPTMPERDLLVSDCALSPAPHGTRGAYGYGAGYDRGRF